MNTTTDYTNRQLDVELLKSVLQPALLVPVTVSNVAKPPKMVTGMEKLVQRYTLLLLTEIGSVKFAPTQGGNLLTFVLNGYVQDVGRLQYAFANANAAVSAMIVDDDLATPTYGSQPADEKLKVARLLDASLDRATATAYLRIQIVSKAEDNFTFVIPVTSK